MIAIVILLCYLVYVDIRKPKDYPKGPRWYPIIGNYTQVSKELEKQGYHHKVWMEFANEYGNMIGLKMGTMLLVVVNGVDLVREVLTRDEFSGRPDGFFFRLRTFGKQIGLVFSEGSFWEKQRKFTVFHLRDLGLGRQKMEALIQEETHDLMEVLKQESAKGPVEIKNAFDISVLNTLWAMTAGKRYNLNDERLNYLARLVHDSFTKVDPSGGLLNQMPLLRFLAPNLCGYNLVSTLVNKITHFISESINEHVDTFDADSPRDLIDMFIKKMHSKSETFTEEQLISLCMDLFMAGSETTSNTLSFAVLYLAEYTDVQRKMQSELNDVLGSRTPTLRDKINLPYTNAVLCEIQRMSNVAPVGVPHKTTCNVTLADCVIPKGTIMLANLFSVHMDEKFWGDPHNFRPERFLNAEGQLEIPDKHFMPFGVGKRRCMGELLAKANYFLVITTLLQNFHIEKNPDDPELNLSGRDGFTLSPASTKLILSARYL